MAVMDNECVVDNLDRLDLARIGRSLVGVAFTVLPRWMWWRTNVWSTTLTGST
jgi:hypothetical protein